MTVDEDQLPALVLADPTRLCQVSCFFQAIQM